MNTKIGIIGILSMCILSVGCTSKVSIVNAKVINSADGDYVAVSAWQEPQCGYEFTYKGLTVSVGFCINGDNVQLTQVCSSTPYHSGAQHLTNYRDQTMKDENGKIFVPFEGWGAFGYGVIKLTPTEIKELIRRVETETPIYVQGFRVGRETKPSKFTIITEI